MESYPIQPSAAAIEVASLIGEKFKLPVTERDGLFWLGEDAVVDVIINNELVMLYERAVRLRELAWAGFRARAALVRRDGVFLKTFAPEVQGLDGWVGRDAQEKLVLEFTVSGVDEINPVRRVAAARKEWFL